MARQFPGAITDYLNTELHAARGTTSNVTVVFNVKLLAQAAAVSVLGMVDGGGDGFGFRLNASGADTILQLHNNATGKSPGAQTMLNLTKFVAVINNVTANTCNFYMGDTADSMALLAGSPHGTALSFSGGVMPDMRIGGRNNNGTQQEPLTAVLSQVSIFFDTILTLAQIREAAVCGNGNAGLATRFYNLNGSTLTDTSPANDTAVVVGAVPAVADICGAGITGPSANEGGLIICI